MIKNVEDNFVFLTDKVFISMNFSVYYNQDYAQVTFAEKPQIK